MNRHIKQFYLEGMQIKGKIQRPHQFPGVNVHDVNYFIDVRLNQFRQVDNPHNFIDFDTEKGQRMYSKCTIMECPACGIDELFHEDEAGNMVCSRCGCAIVH